LDSLDASAAKADLSWWAHFLELLFKEEVEILRFWQAGVNRKGVSYSI
jgi:hypothetical protein